MVDTISRGFSMSERGRRTDTAEMAYQATGIEPRAGAMLPCNIILRDIEGGVEVSAIDPLASMQAIDNPQLTAVAAEVRDLLAKAVAAI